MHSDLDHWRNIPEADLPVFSTQLPPRSGDREAVADFEATVIAGRDENSQGVWDTGLHWQRMRELGFRDEVVDEARFGFHIQLRERVQPYIQGGEREGYYRHVTTELETNITGQESDTVTPTGDRLYEFPLSYRPCVIPPTVVQTRVKEGKIKYRVCKNHTATINGIIVEQEAVLPCHDDHIALLRPNTWMGKMDGRNAFANHPVPRGALECFGEIRPGTREYGRRRFADFGTTIAPAVCMRFALDFVRILGRAAIPCLAYVDDFFFVGRTEGETRQRMDTAKTMAERIRYIFREDGEGIGQQLAVLGVELDTRQGGCARLPHEKVVTYRELTMAALSNTTMTMATLGRLLGKLNFAATWVPGGAARLMALFTDLWGDFEWDESVDDTTAADGRTDRGLQERWPRKLTRGPVRGVVTKEPSIWDDNKIVRLSQGSKADLRWWLTALERNQGVSLHLNKAHPGRWSRPQHRGDLDNMLTTGLTSGGALVVASDAARTPSTAGGGWHLGPFAAAFKFDEQTAQEPIAHLELRAAEQAINTAIEMSRGEREKRILSLVDNTAVRSIISKGASPRPELNRIVSRMLDKAHEAGAEVTAMWLPTAANSRADTLSRSGKGAMAAIHIPTAAAIERIRIETKQPITITWPGSLADRPSEVRGRRWHQWQHGWQLPCPPLRQHTLLVPELNDAEQLIVDITHWKASGLGRISVLVPTRNDSRSDSWQRRARIHTDIHVELEPTESWTMTVRTLTTYADQQQEESWSPVTEMRMTVLSFLGTGH
jgi:hypothetical protein